MTPSGRFTPRSANRPAAERYGSFDMTKTIEKLEATAQLDRALSALSEGLALTQDRAMDNGDDSLETIAAALAKCLQNIFNLKSVGLVDPASPTHIRAAMDHLRKTLTLLHDRTSRTRVEEEITKTVARCLALLYPVSMLIDQIKGLPRQREQAISRNLDVPPRTSAVQPPPDGIEERRSAIRHVVEVEIGVHSGANFFTGFSLDISSGGLFISTYDTLLIGTKVNVNFSLPYGSIFSIDGTVRWIREFNELIPDVIPGMGVQFDALTEEETEMINDFISETPPIFFE
jgi:uncharacterized protein (TIGR02266 family)